MDIQIAQSALKKVAERNGVPVEVILESIQEAIQQSELNKMEIKKGKTVAPEEAVALLADAVCKARQQKTLF